MAPHPDVGEGAGPLAVRCKRAFLLPFVGRAPGPDGAHEADAQQAHATISAMSIPSGLMADPSDSAAAADLRERIGMRALATLAASSPRHAALLEDPRLRERVARAALASDFATDTLRRQPALLEHLAVADPPPLHEPVLDPAQPPDWPAQLRQYRTAVSTLLVWRDVLGLDDVDATLAGSTRLAEDCLRLALAAVEREFAERHGVVRDGSGAAQRLVVFGLGKLGGGELNFSSDIDLVYAYPHDGESDGRRAVAAVD